MSLGWQLWTGLPAHCPYLLMSLGWEVWAPTQQSITGERTRTCYGTQVSEWVQTLRTYGPFYSRVGEHSSRLVGKAAN